MERINIESLKEELENRLNAVETEKLQITEIPMEDINTGSVIELNNREYSNDLEGELLQKLDETKDYSERSNIISQIKMLREQKLIVEAREAKKAKVKEDFSSELKESMQNIQKEMDKLQTRIDKVNEEENKFLKGAETHKKIKGIKGLDEEVYTVADEKTKEYLEKARKKEKSMKRLVSKMDLLKEDYANLEGLFVQINGEKKVEQNENVEQEENVEQNESTVEENVEQNESAVEEKAESNESVLEEKVEPDKPEEPTNTKKSNERPNYRELMRPNAKGEAVKLTPEEMDEFDREISCAAYEYYNNGKKVIVEPNLKYNMDGELVPGSYTIKKVGFEIRNGKPTYYTILEDKQNKEIEVSEEGYEHISIVNDKMERYDALKRIVDQKEYFDTGMAAMLYEIDKEFGTHGAKDYMNLIESKDANSKLVASLNINYDFSELYKNSRDKEDKQKIKQLESIAKENRKIGLVRYQKSPNMLQKLVHQLKNVAKSIKTLKFPIHKNEEQEVEEVAKKEENVPPITQKGIENTFNDMSKYPDFDVEEFIQLYKDNLSQEQADEYRRRSKGEHKQEAFKEGLKVNVASPTEQKAQGEQTENEASNELTNAPSEPKTFEDISSDSEKGEEH